MRDSLRELALRGRAGGACRRRVFLSWRYCTAIPCAASQPRSCCRDFRPAALRRASEPEKSEAWNVSPRLLVALGSATSSSSRPSRPPTLYWADLYRKHLPLTAVAP